MKNNQPVTGVEQDFSIDKNILSTTDLKGIITYVNPDFVEISGFSEEELLRKNHNLIRHPDMPPAAFEDLWKTVKAGKPWMGIVKNRCKNGDHYWVDAFVTPIRNDGTTFEYQSVRYKPERACVERAERLYQRINQGKKIPRSLRARIGLRNLLILGNLLALAPVAATSLIPSLNEFAGIGLFISVALIAAANISIMHPLARLMTRARTIFDNPLMSKIYTDRDDEFGQLQLAMRTRRSQLNAVIGRLSDTNRIIGISSGVTTVAAEKANQGVLVQQSEINQVATAMTEMAATVQEVAKNATLTADATAHGQRESTEGQKVVAETIAAINALKDEIHQSSNVIEKLSKYSENIGGILAVIKGIAEQTNLLALNAAIEAARAGEQGRGFAVVADEVRTLAGRTQQSTLEIEEMIDHLQSGSREAVVVMEKSQSSASNCVEIAGRAGEMLGVLTNTINSISDMNHQIATASEEQSAVADEIQRSIINISEVADQTSAGAKQSVAATEDMGHTIDRLNNLIGQFMDKRR